jgi:hypothetical protein
MQQRQLRLGDILDDYCPRERRVTNHAVVAMVGDDVKQTRCTTCDAEHEYKHAKIPRQRKKSDTPSALYAQVAAGAPKRVVHEPVDVPAEIESTKELAEEPLAQPEPAAAPIDAAPEREPEPIAADADEDDEVARDDDEGPVHRPLIRASLPRPEGQQPPARPIPEFTIRQPGGRPNRFRPRHQRGGAAFSGNNRSNGNFGGPMRGNMRPQGPARAAKRHGGGGRKRSK